MQLQLTATKLFFRFTNNNMKANQHKCHILLGTQNPINVSLDETYVASSSITITTTIPSDLRFDKYISDLRDKVIKLKLNTLSPTAGYMSLEKHTILMKMFVEPQFNYCPLTWISHSRNTNCLI